MDPSPILPEELETLLIQHNIQLSPVLRKKLPVTWQAGFRQISSDGWGNYVGNNDFTSALTPLQAVKDLLSGIRVTDSDELARRARRAGCRPYPPQ